jgi:hypothetical protein
MNNSIGDEMTWISRWKSISTKIDQLQEVSRAYFNSINSFGVDHYGIGGSSIIPAARELYNEVLDLKRNYPMMPGEVQTLIVKLEKNFSGHHKFTGIPGVGGAMVHLGIFNSEMSYYLRDNEILTKDKVKLAFLHLQRTLLVDMELRKKWLAAYGEGEEALEKIGAIHLLSHGLWAFKAANENEKRDLVLSTPIKADEVQEVGAALVLTEWKKISAESLVSKAKEALAGARKYQGSHWAGSELKKEKYLVMVSEHHLEMPVSVIDDEIRYVYVNLSINPAYLDLKNKKDISPSMNWVDNNV